jgi:FkbM family methyltransferase
MTFISYAQNYEDALLHRALSDVDVGVYVDVGANHPNVDSVTKAFYERGWSGINVEPIGSMVALLNQERPRDMNCQVLAGGEEGSKEFYEIADGSGLSTSNREFADDFCRVNQIDLKSYQVPVATLNGLLEKSDFKEVHFLKIDVEGAEKEVLQGLDLSRFRPWIIVVEANLPCSQIANHADWEQLILSQGYRFAWYDGLNRFYLADEQIHRQEHFTTPLNLFDQVVDARLVELRDKALQSLALSNIHDAVNAACELKKWVPVGTPGFYSQLAKAVEVLGEQLLHANQRRSPTNVDATTLSSELSENDHGSLASMEQHGASDLERKSAA